MRKLKRRTAEADVRYVVSVDLQMAPYHIEAELMHSGFALFVQQYSEYKLGKPTRIIQVTRNA